MAVSTEYPSDRCIRPFILTQSFISSIDSSYKELSESSDASCHDEALVKVMIGAHLRQFDSLKAVLEIELPKCPDSASMYSKTKKGSGD
jgi:hypothetical protein